MARIIFAVDGGDRSDITQDELRTIVRGASIEGTYVGLNTDAKAAASAGDTFDIKMTSGHSLSISSADLLNIEVRTYGDTEDQRLRLVGGHRTSARDIEYSIRSIRQVYAITLLLYTDRINELPITRDWANLDLEDYLKADEQLQLSATGIGSFWATVANWSNGGRKAVVAVAGMFFSDGRQALLRHLRARARSEELDVEKKEIDLEFDKVVKLIELYQRIDKIKDPALKNKIINSYEEHLHRLEAPVGLKVINLAKDNN